MNFIFNRPSFAHGGAALLAALTLGLACLFCGFNAGADNLNAGADNNDEYKKCAEQSGQEDACAALNVIRELRHGVELMQKAAVNDDIVVPARTYLLMMQEAAISAAGIMRRPDQWELMREYFDFRNFKIEKKISNKNRARDWKNEQFGLTIREGQRQKEPAMSTLTHTHKKRKGK